MNSAAKLALVCSLRRVGEGRGGDLMKLVCRFIEERIEQLLVSKNSNETEDVVLHGGTLEQWRYIYDGRKFDFFLLVSLSLNDFFF